MTSTLKNAATGVRCQLLTTLHPGNVMRVNSINRLTVLMLNLLLLAGVARNGDAQVARLELRWQNCPAGVMCQRVDGYGTAVAVAHHQSGTVFATAAHSFRSQGAGFKLSRLTVQGKPAELNGQWLDTKSIDFALVFVPRVKFPLVPLATTPPQVGDRFYVSGFDFAVSSRPVIRYYKGEVTKAEHGDFGQTSISWPVGTSGGPVVTRTGELIGIAVHSSGFMINWDFARVIAERFPEATFADATPAARYVRREDARQKTTAPSKPEVKPLPSEAVAAPHPVRASSDQSTDSNNQQTAAEPVAVTGKATRATQSPGKDLPNRNSQRQGESTGTAPESRTSPPASTTRHDAEPVGRVAGTRSRAGEVLDAADSLLLNPWIQAAIVGASGGTGAAALAGWQVLSRLRRRRSERIRGPEKQSSDHRSQRRRSGRNRRERREGNEPYRDEPTPMPSAHASQSPVNHAHIINKVPVPAPVIDWINVDNGFYAKAHDEARRQIGKRYPGAQEVLEAELSLVRQYLAGQQPAQSTTR